MPKQNARGDVIMGAGGEQGSLNQRPYPFATWGRGAWRDDDTILVALVHPPAVHGVPAGAVYSWRPFADPAGQALELVDGRPYNQIAGGGGRWVALAVPPAPAPPMQFGSMGDKPGAGSADVALDGSIVYKTGYHAEAGLTFIDPAGARTDEPGAFPAEYVALPGGRAIWKGGAHGRAPIRPALADAAGAILATLAGEDWIVYWSPSRAALIVQPDGEPNGYVFVTETMFNYDVIARGAVLRLVSSRTSGEGPGDLTTIEISRAGVRYVVGDGAIPAWGPIDAPAPLPRPRFPFLHRVSVYPFKAEGSGRPDVLTLGTYTEAPTPPAPLPAGRLLLGHDSPADWTIPAAALRPHDLAGWELYRVVGESLEQSAARWDRQTRSNLAQWAHDCFVIPMFYNQFNPATGGWLWTDREVLEGLDALARIVNLSPRIKVIAPFAYDRANGIKPNPNLQRTFHDLVEAAARAGEPTLEPIPPTPIDPPDPPDPPASLYYQPKEYPMSATEVGAIKVGPLFARVVEGGAGRGPFGFHQVLFDRETPDDDCKWILSKPDSRYAIEHTKIPILAGADQKEAEDPFWYGKPTNLPNARGILESPVLIKDPASNLIVGYFTWPDRHPTGGTASPSFVWVKLS